MVCACNTCIFQIMPRVLGFLPRGKRSTDPEKVAGMDKVKGHHQRGILVTAQISFQNKCQPQSNWNVFAWMDVSSFTLIDVLVSFPVAVFGYSDKSHLRGLFWHTVQGDRQESQVQGLEAGGHITQHPQSENRQRGMPVECSTLFSKLPAQGLAWSTAMMGPPTTMNTLKIISRHAEANFPSDLDSVPLTSHTDHRDDLHAYTNPLEDQRVMKSEKSDEKYKIKVESRSRESQLALNIFLFVLLLLLC